MKSIEKRVAEKRRATEAREIEEFSLRQAAIAAAKKAQFKAFLKRPRDVKENALDPILPPDITVIHDRELGKLYGQFCAMAAYAHVKATLAHIDHIQYESVYEFSKTKEFLKQNDKTVTMKREKAKDASHVEQAAKKYLEAQAKHLLMESVLEGYQLGKEGCSREMSRRMGLNERKK